MGDSNPLLSREELCVIFFPFVVHLRGKVHPGKTASLPFLPSSMWLFSFCPVLRKNYSVSLQVFFRPLYIWNCNFLHMVFLWEEVSRLYVLSASSHRVRNKWLCSGAGGYTVSCSVQRNNLVLGAGCWAEAGAAGLDLPHLA